jgi:hypothetical protein
MPISPGQKKLLMYGIPAVAALALFVYLRSKSSSAATTATTTTGDTAVGLGQLTDFENSIGAQIASLGQAVAGLQAGTTSPSPAAAPKTPGPAGPTAPFNPYTVGTKVTTSETIVQSLWDPAVKAWLDLTSRGGVYTSTGLGLTGSAFGTGTFAGGGLQLGPNGSFIETSTSGKKTTYSIKPPAAKAPAKK